MGASATLAALEVGDLVSNHYVSGRVIAVHGPWVWVEQRSKDGPLTFIASDLKRVARKPTSSEAA